MKNKNKLLMTIGVLLIPFLGMSQSSYLTSLKECQQLGFEESQNCMLGKSIFDFQGLTFDDKPINIQALKGKVIVVHLWFMSCPPCMAEMEGLNEIVKQYEKKEEVAFISMTIDSKETLLEDFIPSYEFGFEIVPDCESLLFEKLDHMWGFPTTFIVNKEGKIEKIIAGGSVEKEIANKEIKEKVIPVIEKCLKQT